MTQEEQWRWDIWGYHKSLGYSLERMAGLMWLTVSELQEIEQGDRTATEAHAQRASVLWADYLEMEDGGFLAPVYWGKKKIHEELY